VTTLKLNENRGNLFDEIRRVCSGTFEILFGYPPKMLVESETHRTPSDFALRDGDILLLQKQVLNKRPIVGACPPAKRNLVSPQCFIKANVIVDKSEVITTRAGWHWIRSKKPGYSDPNRFKTAWTKF